MTIINTAPSMRQAHLEATGQGRHRSSRSPSGRGWSTPGHGQPYSRPTWGPGHHGIPAGAAPPLAGRTARGTPGRCGLIGDATPVLWCRSPQNKPRNTACSVSGPTHLPVSIGTASQPLPFGDSAFGTHTHTHTHAHTHTHTHTHTHLVAKPFKGEHQYEGRSRAQCKPHVSLNERSEGPKQSWRVGSTHRACTGGFTAQIPVPHHFLFTWVWLWLWWRTLGRVVASMSVDVCLCTTQCKSSVSVCART